jgi:hypothetical protein
MWEKVMESLKEGYICHALSCSIGAILLGGGGPNLAPTVKAAALLGALKSAHKYRSLCVAEGSPTLKEHWTNGSKWKKAGIVSASFLSLAASGVFYLGPSKAATLASELANRASASLQETWHQTLYTTEKKEFTKTKFEWLKTQTVEEEMIRLANLADASHRIYPNEVLFDCALDPNDLTQIEKAYTRLRKEAIKFHPDKHSKDKEELANKAMGVVTDAFNALKEHKNCLKPRDPLDPPLTTEEAKKCADAREKIAPPDGEEPDPASVCYNHDALFTIAKTKLSPHWFARLFGATSKCMISSDDSTSEAPITECADV